MEKLDPWDLISDHCTVEQIGDLLRHAKTVAKNDVLIGAKKETTSQAGSVLRFPSYGFATAPVVGLICQS